MEPTLPAPIMVILLLIINSFRGVCGIVSTFPAGLVVFPWDSLGFPVCCPLFLVYFLTITVRKKAGKNFIFCLVTWPKPETQRIFFLFSWFKSCHYVFLDKQFSTKGLFPLRLRIKYWFSPLSLRYHNDNLLTTVF